MAAALALFVQSGPSPLQVIPTLLGDDGTVYVQEPGHELVYVGEPIHMTVRIRNDDTAAHVLVPSETYGRALFLQRVLAAGAPSRSGVGVPMVLGNEVISELPNRHVDVGWPNTFPMAGGEMLTWTTDLTPPPSTPGLYDVRVDCTASDDVGRPLVGGVLHIEIRAVTPDALPEVHRRAAGRAWAERRFADAETESNALLAADPHSVEAYLMLGALREREGKKAEALADERLALQALAQGQDLLLVRFATPTVIHDMEFGISQHIQALQKP